MKTFKTIEEQIVILKDRGLLIRDEPKAAKYLLSNNYYNIINGYSKFFQHPDTDAYIEGVTFDEVATLYIFDKDVKRAILQAILEAEHHIKSITAHIFSKTYPDQRYAYLNTNSYDNSKILDVGYIVSKLSKIINKNKKYSGNSIHHYARTHSDVPIWVLTDYLEFGDLRMIIENLPNSIQNDIARELTSFIKSNIPDFDNVFPPETLISFLKNINEVRNKCAHNNRLLNFKCRSNSTFWGIIHNEEILMGDDSRKTVYSTIISLQCFISGAKFNSLWNTLRKKIIKLDAKIPSLDINIINRSLGFPDDWHENPARK